MDKLHEILEFAWIHTNNETNKIVIKVQLNKKNLTTTVEDMGLDNVIRIAKESVEAYIYQTLDPTFKGGEIKTQSEIVKNILTK
jgi:anti-sigma regulatory factor (Ser/Thr protein kinase)